MTVDEPRTVTMLCSARLLHQLLRLDESTNIVGARHETRGTVPWLVLDVYAPHAPEGVVQMHPHYQRVDSHPDPVSLIAVDWEFDDGTRSTQTIAPPSKDGS